MMFYNDLIHDSLIDPSHERGTTRSAAAPRFLDYGLCLGVRNFALFRRIQAMRNLKSANTVEVHPTFLHALLHYNSTLHRSATPRRDTALLLQLLSHLVRLAGPACSTRRVDPNSWCRTSGCSRSLLLQQLAAARVPVTRLEGCATRSLILTLPCQLATSSPRDSGGGGSWGRGLQSSPVERVPWCGV
jgi:hypothetical protein